MNSKLAPKLATSVGIFSPYGFADPLKVRIANVVPGEPLHINWRFRRFLDPWNPDWGRTWNGSITVRFFIEGYLVHERSDIAVTNESNQIDNIIIQDRNIANIVYRIGRKSLEIVIVRNDKATASPFSWSEHFWVLPEPIDASWWQWRVATFESVAWKDGYALVADFVNNSRFAAVAHLSAELSEVRSEENPDIEPCGYLPVQFDTRDNIAARDRRSLSFKFRQDWTWLVPAAWIIKGPLDKIFAYSAWFQCTDEYGNVYKGVCSSRLTRWVEVSFAKRLAGDAAFAAAISAAGFVVAAGIAAATVVGLALAAALAGYAASAYAVASSAGLIAQDPPAPDPEFREPVAVESLPLLKWPEPKSPIPQPLDVLRSLLETAAHILALENARTVTRSRLMGATIFGDQEAQERQRQRYLEIEKEMGETAFKLDQILAEFERTNDAYRLFDPTKAAAWADTLVAEGLSLPLLKVMAEAGLTPEQINELAVLVTRGWLMELVKERGLFLVPFVVSLQGFVQEVQGQREIILAGETYIEAHHPRERASKDSIIDGEAQLRPRRCE